MSLRGSLLIDSVLCTCPTDTPHSLLGDSLFHYLMMSSTAAPMGHGKGSSSTSWSARLLAMVATRMAAATAALTLGSICPRHVAARSLPTTQPLVPTSLHFCTAFWVCPVTSLWLFALGRGMKRGGWVQQGSTLEEGPL